MTYNKLCLIVFAILCCNVCTKAQQRYYAFETSYLFDIDNLPKADLNVLKAIEVWKQYILKGNDTCFVKKDFADSALKKNIDRQLFSTSFPSASVNFHVVTYEKIKNEYILETIIKYKDPGSSDVMILSYFRIGCRLENGRYKLFSLIDEYMSKLNKIPTKWMDYYYKEKDKKPSAYTIKKANHFCDSVSTIFHLSKDEKVAYILNEKNRNYEIFGHYYHWNAIDAQNVEARGKHFILDNTTSGFYSHELVHFLFKDYHPVNTLNEGLATWLAGTSVFSYRQAVDSLKRTSYSDSTILFKMLHQLPPYWQPFYHYTMGAIIVEYAYRSRGEKFLKDLISDNSSEDIFVLLKKHFQLSNQSSSQFLIEIIRKS